MVIDNKKPVDFNNSTQLIPKEWKHICLLFTNNTDLDNKIRAGKHIYIDGVLSHFADVNMSSFSQNNLSKIELNGDGMT